jgi:subtilisin
MVRGCPLNEPIFTIPPDLIRGPDADVLPLAGEVNWGMAVFGVDRLRTLTDGAGVVAAGVDTGIDRTHPLLSNCFAAKDFTGSPIGAGDRNQHGTHISGTISATDPRIGVAPGCRFCHGKALSDGGSGSGSWIAAAIRWAAEQGAEVISMSLGSSSPDNTIIAAMQEVARAGIWVIAAAGNSGANTPDVDWPGRSEHCISVAALSSDLSPASFSSAGAKIDTSGPGVGIWSTKPGGGFQQMSGTSMATPFVAGLMTLYRAALKTRGLPIPDVYALRALLFNRSTDTFTPGDDRRTGPGWVNPMLLSVNLTPDPPPLGV